MLCEVSPFRASNRNALHINWTSNAFALKQIGEREGGRKGRKERRREKICI